MSELENMIRKYASLHPDVDLDTAAYRVLVDQIKHVERICDTEGLYDRLFKEAGK